jgi:RNA polymerase sigma-70 factor (ECF subfamily)
VSAAAARAAETVARTSYGRLVAILSARTRDIAGAEDALAEAFRLALETWERDGVPDRPEAWLITVARRAILKRVRHDAVRAGAAATLATLADEAAAREASEIPDERLALLFVCAHPAIDEAARTPLMLQTVLGLDAARIAAAFLVAPATMGQRLVRAKAKIKDAGIPFAVPERRELGPRLDAVLAAIYAAFGAAFDAQPGADASDGLAAEAIHLARTLAGLMPGEPEPLGLLALVLYVEARAPARRGPDGGFVPLAEQDPRLWRRDAIIEAEAALTGAARMARPGRYQTEAAIQAVHSAAGMTGRREPAALAALYDVLAAQAPSVGVAVARAAAYGEAYGPLAGLAALDALAAQADLSAYQPAFAARAHLLAAAGRQGEAAVAYERAIALARDGAVRAFLEARRAGLAAA